MEAMKLLKSAHTTRMRPSCWTPEAPASGLSTKVSTSRAAVSESGNRLTSGWSGPPKSVALYRKPLVCLQTLKLPDSNQPIHAKSISTVLLL